MNHIEADMQTSEFGAGGKYKAKSMFSANGIDLASDFICIEFLRTRYLSSRLKHWQTR